MAADPTYPDQYPAGERKGGSRSCLGMAAWGVAGLVVLAILLAAAGGFWLRSRLTASLPRTTGEVRAGGLGAAVQIDRDALGVPTVAAASRLDAALALGFLHAQERFFQMDLMRRSAAGELAELVGPAALPTDRDHRVHRGRALAESCLLRASPQERALVAAYTRGVNAGLAALAGPPPEYLLLRTAPAPWREADSYLAVLAMFFNLNDSHATTEAMLGDLQARLPRPLYEFIEPIGTEWDAPLAGAAYTTPPIPGPDVLDLRQGPVPPAPRRPPRAADLDAAQSFAAATGSNNWAVSGAHTADGGALLANDMHLGLSLPNVWYRAVLRWRDAGGAQRQLAGVTLPGTPGVAVGSNGHVAWGFTNSYGDWTDLIDLELDPKDPDVYMTPAGPRHFLHQHERIAVKGRPDQDLDVLATIWGPVIERTVGHRRALAWTAHHPEALNLSLAALEDATTVAQAIEAAHGAGIPPQNFTVVDDHGHIGWTIIGKIPRRVGFDGRTPTSWADGRHSWNGWVSSAEVPQVVDPPSGRIWTANARTMDGQPLALLGNSGYDLGARAQQIRDDLLRLEGATPRDLLAIQLDDRAVLMARWRTLLLGVLTPQAVQADPHRATLRRVVGGDWDGRASIASVGYRAVRAFRGQVALHTFASLTGLGSGERGAQALRLSKQFEGPLWRLVSERPPHLLARRYATWDAALLAAADATIAQAGAKGLDGHPWGERNALAMRHPLSRVLPFLSGVLDVPAHWMPGDTDMPRVQGPSFGASERLVVSPGREAQGLFEMPGGESGHFLSPHYRDGEAAWERGLPTPLLPGATVATLRLVPPGR
jgi:penicillin G amidase